MDDVLPLPPIIYKLSQSDCDGIGCDMLWSQSLCRSAGEAELSGQIIMFHTVSLL